MKYLFLAGSFIFNLIAFAQTTPVASKEILKSTAVAFKTAEPKYNDVQKQLGELEQEKKLLLKRLNAFNEKQKQVLANVETLEKNYNTSIATLNGSNVQDQLLDATKQMQETQMSFNLQYLQLQNQMQHENRSYTAVSNVLKTKHDTVKNSIGNVR